MAQILPFYIHIYTHTERVAEAGFVQACINQETNVP